MRTMFLIPKHRRNAGNGILLALLVTAILVPVVVLCFDVTSNRGRTARRGGDYTACNAAADAVLEFAFAKWKDWIKRNGGRLPTVANCANTSSPSTTQLGITRSAAQALFDASPKFRNAVVTELTVEPVDANDLPVSATLTDEQQKIAMRTLVPLERFPRRIGRAYNYRVTATVTMPTIGSSQVVRSRVCRYFRKTDASLWQAMMWFEGDIELFPSPEMVLYGWLHTNSNGYLCHANNTANLSINSEFTFSGSPSTLNKGSNSEIKDARGLVFGVSRLQQELESGWDNWKAPIWNAGGYDSQVSRVERLDPLSVRREEAINVSDTDLNNDSLREIIERPNDTNNDGKRTRADDSIHFQDRRYYNMADFKIIVDRSAAVADRIKILDRNDVRLDPATNSFAAELTTNVLKRDVGSGLPSSKDFYDYREAGNVTSSSSSAADAAKGHITVTNLDVSKLTPLLDNTSNSSYYSTGVIYFKDQTPPKTAGVYEKKAVRMLKGGTLPRLGMTLVTEDGIYVQGDYNTGTTYDPATGALVYTPASNQLNGDPLKNTVPGYELKPAALCADAVTFLSNSWQEKYNSSTPTSDRAGSATTFNTAFLAGHVPTNTSYPTDPSITRSGGGINFPRVLEKWSGNALTYHGSMVQLFDSKVFNAPWSPYIYGAPKRLWNFENRFLNTPPPGPLDFTEYSRGRFFRPAH